MIEGVSPQLPKRATLSVVARAAGVSTATASKVLNNRPDVAPETRRRVTNTLLEFGYEPTTGPRDRNRDPVVTVVFDSLVNLYSTQVLRGVLVAAREIGVDIVVEVLTDLGNTGNPPLSIGWIKSIARKGWLGVLAVTTEITPAQARAFRDHDLLLVAIDPPNVMEDSVVSVGSTNFIGGVQAADHLITLGHRRIAVAGGPTRSPLARERLGGYRSALEAADLVPDEDLILAGDFTYDAGVGMAVALLTHPHPPTAVVTGCDAMALGVLEGARRMGVRVPQDLSVVGFDDTPAAASSAPPLTTVRQPMKAFGRVALQSLMQHALGEQPMSHHIQLATSLVLRESTAALPKSHQARRALNTAAPAPQRPRESATGVPRRAR